MQTNAIGVTELSFEDAYDLIDALENKEVYHGDGASVHQGVHPTRGSIMVIVPPLGNSLILPVAIPSISL